MSGPADFQQRVTALAVERLRPDGTPYKSLSEEDCAALARQSGLPLREAQALALECGAVPERYVRNFQALDPARQCALLRSRALLVGLGGLGGNVLEILARMGVGRIDAADGDVFEASNLNRQLLSSLPALGAPKAQAALKRTHDVNPAVDLAVREHFLDEASMTALAHGATVVLDALGGLDARPALARAAAAAGVPLVTAAIAGMSGYVATVLPGACGPADFIGQGGGAEDALGSPAPAVALAATLQASEALRILSGEAPTLAGKMLLFDLRDMSFETMTLG